MSFDSFTPGIEADIGFFAPFIDDNDFVFPSDEAHPEGVTTRKRARDAGDPFEASPATRTTSVMTTPPTVIDIMPRPPG